MNASSTAATEFIEDNANGSDSDTNPDEVPEYYQPISAVDDEDVNSDEEHTPDFNHRLPNGYCSHHQAENGISSLDLNEDAEQKSSDDDDEEEEEESIREASESAIRVAFREDENRRNAPLSAENATRVMEAMRGVSFGGIVPDWAGRVPEDWWIDQLRTLRQPPNTSTSLQN